MSIFNFRNRRIYYSDKGSGEVVVLIHGFLENSAMWRFVDHDISRTHRVIEVDLPGHGKSEMVADFHTMDLMAEIIEELLSHLQISQFSLIGHSMGGYVSLALMEMFPQRVERAMLFYSTARSDDKAKKESRLQAAELAEKDSKSFVRHAIPMLFRPKSRPIYKSEIQQLIKQSSEMSPEAIKASLLGMRVRPDRCHLLKSAKTPVSFVSGKYDPAVPLENVKDQHKMKGVSHVTITDNGHMGFIEDRKICRESILRFVYNN